MKYLLMMLVSFQAMACKPEISDKKDSVCEQCQLELGKCMSKAIDASDVMTESEVRQFRNDCRNVLQVCTMKNQCLNKE